MVRVTRKVRVKTNAPRIDYIFTLRLILKLEYFRSPKRKHRRIIFI